MLFNSLHFLIFFPVVVCLYFIIPNRFRWALLLAASYYFYMSWQWEYAGLLATSTLVDYFVSRKMDGLQSKKSKLPFLILSIITNIGILAVFKYFNFFIDNINEVLGDQNQFSAINVLLPMGISFYTFQTLAYTVDVYRGKQRAEKHFGKFALYVSFFPQLVAGPIERASNLLGQFKLFDYEFDSNRILIGLKKMLWGFFKKLVIADRLAIYVNEAYNYPQEQSGVNLLIATYFFAIQIYCDFSGYTDIAIGAARIFGIDLKENFRFPYFAKNIRAFWSRWHISLSTWFRDYVYIPLGGNRHGMGRMYLSIAIVFLVSGFWHGANWTFIVWGALHGIYYMIYLAMVKLRWFKGIESSKVASFFSGLFLFNIVVFAWIFFRANSLDDAFIIISRIIDLDTWSAFSLTLPGFGIWSLALSVFTIAFMILTEVFYFRKNDNNTKPNYSLAFAAILLGLIIIIGKFDGQDFIYFQF